MPSGPRKDYVQEMVTQFTSHHIPVNNRILNEFEDLIRFHRTIDIKPSLIERGDE